MKRLSFVILAITGICLAGLPKALYVCSNWYNAVYVAYPEIIRVIEVCGIIVLIFSVGGMVGSRASQLKDERKSQKNKISKQETTIGAQETAEYNRGNTGSTTSKPYDYDEEEEEKSKEN